MTSERPGIDYALVKSPSRRMAARMREPHAAWREFGAADWQISYQKCLYCERGIGELRGLFRLALHQNVCEHCRTYFAAQPLQSFK